MSPTRASTPRSAARLALTAACLALLPLAPHAATTAPTLLDLGRFTVSQEGRPARVEEFAIQRQGDSLVVQAASARWAARESDLYFDKHMQLVVDAADFDLAGYSSQLVAGSDTLRRGVSLARGDTAVTLWREVNRYGTGDVVGRPPGRLYVLDPPVFTLFGFIGWTLRDRDCDRRPIHTLVLGARDTMVDATVTDAGQQPLEWGGHTVTTRKLLISDQQTTIEAWFTPEGHMLRLEHPGARIRAERQAPAPAAEPARGQEPAPTR